MLVQIRFPFVSLKARMMITARKKFQILQLVVIPDPVLMVDYLIISKRTAKMLRHDQTMFRNEMMSISHTIEKMVRGQPD